MFHQNLLEPSHQFSFSTHLRKYLGAKAAQFLAEHASVNIFRFRGFLPQKIKSTRNGQICTKIFKKGLILLTFVGAEAAQFLAEHASITSFVAATVNQTTFFATIESLATAWAKILLLLFCCTVVPNCLNPPKISSPGVILQIFQASFGRFS